MSLAQSIMIAANENGLVGNEGELDIMIEDVIDPDSRIYRIEYQSTPDAQHAIAWCRFNPWGSLNGGERYEVGHVHEDGFLCVGTRSVRSVAQSPYSLQYVIRRVRYWCTAFSMLKESGVFPQPLSQGDDQ